MNNFVPTMLYNEDGTVVQWQIVVLPKQKSTEATEYRVSRKRNELIENFSQVNWVKKVPGKRFEAFHQYLEDF